MKKLLFFAFILLILSFVLILSGCGAALDEAAALSEYEVGGDLIPSITAVVGQREVTGVESQTSNGIPSRQYTYASDVVFEDLFAYVSMLREGEGWLVTEAYDLAQVPGTAQLGRESKDDGQILLLSIAYEDAKYAIKITKLEGTIE